MHAQLPAKIAARLLAWDQDHHVPLLHPLLLTPCFCSVVEGEGDRQRGTASRPLDRPSHVDVALSYTFLPAGDRQLTVLLRGQRLSGGWDRLVVRLPMRGRRPKVGNRGEELIRPAESMTLRCVPVKNTCCLLLFPEYNIFNLEFELGGVFVDACTLPTSMISRIPDYLQDEFGRMPVCWCLYFRTSRLLEAGFLRSATCLLVYCCRNLSGGRTSSDEGSIYRSCVLLEWLKESFLVLSCFVTCHLQSLHGNCSNFS